MLPEQTAENDLVDVVVRGEAELVVGELAKKIVTGQKLDEVKGITYKAEGVVRNNPDADVVDLNTIPMELRFVLVVKV